MTPTWKPIEEAGDVDALKTALDWMGIDKIEVEGGEIRFACPMPNCHSWSRSRDRGLASMEIETSRWYCHGCNEKGNLKTLLRFFHLRAAGDGYASTERVRSVESSGAHDVIAQQIEATRQLLAEGWTTTQIIAELDRRFGIKRTAAKTRIAAARGELEVVQRGGKRMNSRLVRAAQGDWKSRVRRAADETRRANEGSASAGPSLLTKTEEVSNEGDTDIASESSSSSPTGSDFPFSQESLGIEVAPVPRARGNTRARGSINVAGSLVEQRAGRAQASNCDSSSGLLGRGAKSDLSDAQHRHGESTKLENDDRHGRGREGTSR